MPDLYAYAHHLARYRQQHPGEDVMSTVLAQGEAVGVEEFENMFWLFAVAGNETLRNGLPGGMHALLSHPEAQRRLRAEPDLVEPAVEEMLRWWTPVMVFRRTATRDVEVAGRPVDRGQKVVVSFLSANRDPRVFDDPGAFRVDRNSRAAPRLRARPPPVRRRPPGARADAGHVHRAAAPYDVAGGRRGAGAAALVVPARGQAAADELAVNLSRGSRRRVGSLP